VGEEEEGAAGVREKVVEEEEGGVVEEEGGEVAGIQTTTETSPKPTIILTKRHSYRNQRRFPTRKRMEKRAPTHIPFRKRHASTLHKFWRTFENPKTAPGVNFRPT